MMSQNKIGQNEIGGTKTNVNSEQYLAFCPFHKIFTPLYKIIGRYYFKYCRYFKIYLHYSFK
jgi:hypothetical protein